MSPDTSMGPAGPSLLIDLRPCYEGFAGIPQETRLLFAMFAGLRLRRYGALASGSHFVTRHGNSSTPFGRVLDQTKALISQDTRRAQWAFGIDAWVPEFLRRRLFKLYLVLTEKGRSDKLNMRIDSEMFEDFLWMKLFDLTLPPKDRHLIHRAEFYATELGHDYARGLSLLPRAFQRRVDTTGWDIMFCANVSPYLPAAETTMMVRYYDALPLLSPHTIGEPWPHAMSHARMLERNMQNGASFYCDSEPVRNDLLKLFPEAEKRVHTIPATVAADYYPDVRPERELQTILCRRQSPLTAADRPPQARLPKLFMATSTLEPRKNYLKLFRAFEIARGITNEPIQLLIVANPGWRSEAEVAELKTLVREGAYHLCGVPLSELRVLYSMAHGVVAPSRAEGFDYSGVEAMACGTPLIASDIPVHRWVYGEAAEYFDPYSEEELGAAIARFAELPRHEGHLAELRDLGLRQAALYSPKALAPVWEQAILRQTVASGISVV